MIGLALTRPTRGCSGKGDPYMRHVDGLLEKILVDGIAHKELVYLYGCKIYVYALDMELIKGIPTFMADH